jgi:pimeloyl-ACP methyl ester carboxylesterase
MREISVTIDGVRSPLLEFGSRDVSEAVVFVHGNPGSSRDWERLARGAGEFGRAVAMDMPGFGAADKPPNFDYSVPGYARFLGRLLGELGIRHAHLVMHDFGGRGGWPGRRPIRWELRVSPASIPEFY